MYGFLGVLVKKGLEAILELWKEFWCFSLVMVVMIVIDFEMGDGCAGFG